LRLFLDDLERHGLFRDGGCRMRRFFEFRCERGRPGHDRSHGARGDIGDGQSWNINRCRSDGRLRRVLHRRQRSNRPADLQPHIVSTPRRHDREAIRPLLVVRQLELDRAVLVERLALVRRQQLLEHPDDRVGRQHTGRQLDVPPGDGTPIRVHRSRRRHHVWLLADVHDQRVPFEPRNRVEQ
jgi:hypothetical protein